jgi:hypothetical protein
MFMGIRRCLLGRDWFSLSASSFHLFQVRSKGYYEIRALPTPDAGGNEPFVLPPAFAEALEHPCSHTYRDFEFTILEAGADGIVLALKFQRRDPTVLGNRLRLSCHVTQDDSDRTGA